MIEGIIDEEKAKGNISRNLDTLVIRSIFASIIDGSVYYTFLSKKGILKDNLHENYRDKYLAAAKALISNLK